MSTKRYVARLTYREAATNLYEAQDAVERLEDDLRAARRMLRQAEAEMYHALYERLPERLR